MKSCFEMNENENAKYKNFQDAAKAVIKGKFIAIKCLN